MNNINLKIMEFNIQQMIPQSWFTKPENSSVWLSGYRMLRLNLADLPSGPKFMDLDNIRIVFVYGKVNYLNIDAATPKFTTDGHHVLSTSNLKTSTDEGAYLIVIIPFEIDGVAGNERSVRERISDTIGLLIAFNDRNMAFEHIFDYVIQLNGKEQSVIGRTVTNPFSMPKPDISDNKLLRIQNAGAKIANLNPQDRNRTQLSLRWFETAIYDEGTDAFLKYWIALETLAMPDTTNIKPINEAISAIYGFSGEQTAETFHIGRIFNLRGRIVHSGEKFPVSAYLLDFICAIYVDILFSILGLESEKRSLTLLQSGQFNPEKHLLQI